ncbi:MAG: hypothetical protein R2754_02895 [Microthrixaceae bacterium]
MGASEATEQSPGRPSVPSAPADLVECNSVDSVVTIQHNMQGREGAYPNGGIQQFALGIYSYIEDCVDDGLPLAISANEVCGKQFAALAGWAQAHGYFYHEEVTVKDQPGCPNSGFDPQGKGKWGNFIMVRPDGAQTATQLGMQVLPNGGEARGYGCVKTFFNSQPKYAACSTHLDADLEDSLAQANALEPVVTGWFVEYPEYYINGDFNIPYADMEDDTDWMEPGFTDPDFGGEADDYMDDSVRATAGTPLNRRKIDYSFTRFTFDDIQDAEVVEIPPSDHSLLAGFLEG